SVRFECQYANMRLITRIKHFALAVRRHGEDLSLISRGYIQGSIGAKHQIPDIFCLRIEEHRLFARDRNLVDLPIRRSPDVERSLLIKCNGLSREVRRIKYRCRFTRTVEAKHLRWRTASRVKRALRVDTQRPQIGSIRVRQQSELWRQL